MCILLCILLSDHSFCFRVEQTSIKTWITDFQIYKSSDRHHTETSWHSVGLNTVIFKICEYGILQSRGVHRDARGRLFHMGLFTPILFKRRETKIKTEGTAAGNVRPMFRCNPFGSWTALRGWCSGTAVLVHRCAADRYCCGGDHPRTLTSAADVNKIAPHPYTWTLVHASAINRHIQGDVKGEEHKTVRFTRTALKQAMAAIDTKMWILLTIRCWCILE